ncbi:MAG: RHS repeat-associated core domain-containing protein [Chloroflexota bacterium]|nr:RHS repeat-associated core domain-containing protein [Chloroflexota bacterium]
MTGDGTYSLRISSTSTNGAGYSSQEGSNPPELVLTLGGTPAPTNTPTLGPSPTPTRTPTPSATPIVTNTPTPTAPAAFSSAAFVYDGDGKRVKSTFNNNATTTYFVGAHYEVTGSTITKYYYAGSQRIAMRTNDTLNYLVGDHLGSTSLVTDSTGVKINEQRYKAWGETRYTFGNEKTKYQYTGQFSYTADFGLYFYNARWYDPSLGRFAQADTIIPQSQGVQAWDRYAYVNNNPIKYVDPNGHEIKPPACPICNITWLNYSNISGIANSVADGATWVGCLLTGCHVNMKEDTVTGPTVAEWMYSGVMGMVTPLDVPPSASAAALRQNFDRGLQLANDGQINQHVSFFEKGLSDAPVPNNVPVADIQNILGQTDGNLYVVGKPGTGSDLDMILVQNGSYSLTDSQMAGLNSLAQEAGFTDIHLQIMTTQQAAAFRFATSSTTPLHAVPNLRNPMIWRRIEAK